MSSQPEESESIDRQFSATLERGLRVLACFDARSPFLTNKEISARTAIPSPTVSRLTYTLTLLGYLKHHRQLGKYGKYELGAAVLSLAHPLLANVSLRQVARVPMRELAERFHGWVSLGSRERLSMVYVETARPRSALDVKPDIGQTFSIPVSAMGRAYLAALPVAESELIVNQLRVRQPELLTEYGSKIAQSRADFSRYGFCLSLGDYDNETYAAAVPFHAPENGELMVFNSAIRANGRAPKELVRHLTECIGPSLLEMVASVKRALETSRGASIPATGSAKFSVNG